MKNAWNLFLIFGKGYHLVNIDTCVIDMVNICNSADISCVFRDDMMYEVDLGYEDKHYRK